MGWVSDEVLREVVVLAREVLVEKRETAAELARLTGRIDALTAKVGNLLDENAEIRGDIGEVINQIAAFKGEVMSQLDNVKADLATLKSERDEIVAFIESKAAELVVANGKVQELLAKVAELEQNVISPEEIAEVRADIQGVSDSLNTYTPPAPVEPPAEPV